MINIVIIIILFIFYFFLKSPSILQRPEASGKVKDASWSSSSSGDTELSEEF